MTEDNPFIVDYENNRRLILKSLEELRAELLQGENWLNDEVAASADSKSMNQNYSKIPPKAVSEKNSPAEQSPGNPFEFRKNLFDRLGLRDKGKLYSPGNRAETSR